MNWDYQNIPRHPVAAENLKTRGRIIIILHYHYRVDTELGKYVCAICRITCACPECVAQHDEYWLPNIVLSSQPRYAHVVKIVTIIKYLNITIIGS